MNFDQNSIAIIVALLLILILLRSRKKPRITLSELNLSFYHRRDDFELHNEFVKPLKGAKVNVQLLCDDMSVLYHYTHDFELFDVSMQGKRGLIFTVRDGKIVTLQWVGGRSVSNPLVTKDDLQSTLGFAEQVRERIRNKSTT